MAILLDLIFATLPDILIALFSGILSVPITLLIEWLSPILAP